MEDATHPATSLARVPGGSDFWPIQAQQLGCSTTAASCGPAAFVAGHREHAWAQHFAGAFVRAAATGGQQTLAEHNAAHTPGAMAFANRTVASTKRVTILIALRGVTPYILIHYRRVRFL
jgi:hypothetical protein